MATVRSEVLAMDERAYKIKVYRTTKPAQPRRAGSFGRTSAMIMASGGQAVPERVADQLAAVAPAGLGEQWLIWLFTVAPEIRSLRAISSLDRPDPISVSTSISRSVSPSGGPLPAGGAPGPPGASR